MFTLFRSRSKRDAIGDQLFGFVTKVQHFYHCLFLNVTFVHSHSGFVTQGSILDGHLCRKESVPSFLQHFHSPFPGWSLTVEANVSVLRFASLVVPVEATRCLQLHTVSKAREREMNERVTEWKSCSLYYTSLSC